MNSDREPSFETHFVFRYVCLCAVVSIILTEGLGNFYSYRSKIIACGCIWLVACTSGLIVLVVARDSFNRRIAKKELKAVLLTFNSYEIFVLEQVLSDKRGLFAVWRHGMLKRYDTEEQFSIGSILEKLNMALDGKDWGKYARSALLQESITGRKKYFRDVTEGARSQNYFYSSPG